MDPDISPSSAGLSKPANQAHFDIVIAGGGTVGSLLALALSQLPGADQLKIAIVEAQSADFLHSRSASSHPEPNDNHPAFDNRAIAISHHSLNFLDSLGLGEHIAQVTTAIRDIHVSDQHYLGQAMLSADALGVEASGRVIELQQFGRILHSALGKERISESQDHCRWFCPDSIAQVTVEQHAVQLTLQSEQCLSTSLLLVTEGGNSSTRSQLPVITQVYDYQQSAIIVNVAMSQPHANRAFERFTESGPLAFLPMTADRCSVVWTIAREQENYLLNMSDEHFAQALQDAFGYRLGKVIKVGKRQAYPLRLVLSNSQHLHRVALLGNAAQSLHPIAGQGFNLGLRDVEDMINTLRSCFQQGNRVAPNLDQNALDLGAFEVLSTYRRKRKTDVQHTVLATHGLVQLFSNRAVLPVIGRNLGLFCLDNMPTLKRWFGMRAMGEFPSP